MGARIGVSLKVLQWFLRGITFGCAIVVLGIYGYFLATLHTHDLFTPTWVKAVEGLAGAAAAYSLIGLLLLWCLAGHRLASATACFFDICFVAAFVYIAAANRGGAGSCNRGSIRTPFGTGDASSRVRITNKHGGVIKLPSFHTACKLESASLAVAVIAIVFLILAFINEMMLARNHRRERAAASAAAAEAAAAKHDSNPRRFGLFGRRNRPVAGDAATVDPNALPSHAQPAHLRDAEATAGLDVKEGTYGNPKY